MIGKTVTGQQVDGTAATRDIVGREMFNRSFDRLTSFERAEVDKDTRVVAALADSVNAGQDVRRICQPRHFRCRRYSDAHDRR